jgi:uncharacterized membrane protein
MLCIWSMLCMYSHYFGYVIWATLIILTTKCDLDMYETCDLGIDHAVPTMILGFHYEILSLNIYLFFVLSCLCENVIKRCRGQP